MPGQPLDRPVAALGAGLDGAVKRESFGALHQMLAGLAPQGREEAWQQIGTELSRFDSADGFEGPCELIVAWGTK